MTLRTLRTDLDQTRLARLAIQPSGEGDKVGSGVSVDRRSMPKAVPLTRTLWPVADTWRVMAPLDADELWERARKGDDDAFGSLFDLCGPAIYSYCFRRTADQALAEDLMSVVFLEAWRRHRDVSPQRVLPWLYGVATNVLRNQWRSTRRYRGALRRLPVADREDDFVDDLASRLDAEERMRAILAVVRSLPEPEQDVLALCIWQGLTSGEAAEALAVPAGTVRSRLHRAREHLADASNLPTVEVGELAPCEGKDIR
jgi:RNA polymerase sigma factor (sigma-70 family)